MQLRGDVCTFLEVAAAPQPQIRDGAASSRSQLSSERGNSKKLDREKK